MHIANPDAALARHLPSFALATAIGLAACSATAQNYNIETIATGLTNPWGMDFLPGGAQMLVTERPGRVQLVDLDDGTITEISGAPQVDARGQGGLLDIALHPDFDDNGWVYMTWAGTDEADHTATHLGRARLDTDAMTFVELEVLHIAGPFVNSRGHYGSRIVFDAEGHVYFSTGDRQSKDFGPDHYSQDLGTELGKILRLNDDGSIPADNPFVGDPDAADSIFSYGHRNPQGMAVHPETGEIWINEHGENNGDEINVLVAGGNFGWPIATYGVDYRTGQAFAPTPPEVPETVDPVYWWDQDHPQGFPPSGFAFYEGDAFPEWQGHAFMGTLANRYLGVFSIDGHQVEQTGRLLEDQVWRIRDVAVGPEDGYIYVIVDDSNAPLVRLTPVD